MKSKEFKNFDSIVNELSGEAGKFRHDLPSHRELVEIVEDLRSVLFPGHFGPSDLSRTTVSYHIGSTLSRNFDRLNEQVLRGLCSVCADDEVACSKCKGRAFDITNTFFERLPVIQRLLITDVEAAYKGDPAATSRDEAIFCYPGILAITNQRIAHEMQLLGVPLLPRLITEHAHSITGIDIHPGARIGDEFFIDHGTGVVIGETCIIGNRVRIYQGVTLGAKSFPLDEKGNPIKGVDRHPIIEDDVIIYAGATILGRVRVGKGSVIGGNVWLTHDVPVGSRISQTEPK